GAQSIDLERNRGGEVLAQIGELENQNEIHEFKEALELYVKPRGTWNVPTINKKEEGDVEEVVNRFLTSKDRLTSHDKEILEKAANEFLIKQKTTLLIETVNSFFEPENQLTIEDINILKVAANQYLALKDKKALKLLEMAVNEFLESPKEGVLKDAIFENPLVLENELSLENKLDLGHLATEDAKEILETAVNKLLTSKRKKVLLILGSGGTGKSTFNPPLEEFINKNQDFIEAYLREKGKLTADQIKELRNRKFVFILDGYDEIAERERHCYDSNMFSKWKYAKIIISCRPEYLDDSSGKMFWPKENGERGFQKLTLTPFSWAEIEQYIMKYVDYSKKNGSPLPWNAYIKQIKNIPQIEDLVCNPILLKIALTILPGLLGKSETSQINRIVLYDEFIKKWFERAQNRLRNIQLKPKEREAFDLLNVDFTKHCLQFGKEFAFKMFVDNNKVVVNYDPINEEITSVWAMFLGNTVEKSRLIRFSMPLIRRGNQYWFFHKSLRDYLISCALLDSFNDTSQTSLFNKHSIITEPAIQQFLAERVQQMPEHIQSLFNFIECSKKSANIEIASANAITVIYFPNLTGAKNLVKEINQIPKDSDIKKEFYLRFKHQILIVESCVDALIKNTNCEDYLGVKKSFLKKFENFLTDIRNFLKNAYSYSNGTPNSSSLQWMEELTSSDSLLPKFDDDFEITDFNDSSNFLIIHYFHRR
ncbi:21633_t:CDS:2, partial [Dentiscutata erythropus]